LISENLLKKRWDYIFFTGSVAVGKIVAKAAAENLTPVTLELGGKSPCIVDETADLRIAAKRIIWGKMVNAGQTCIAPDYLLVQESVKEKLVQYLIETLKDFYGAEPENSADYARIINSKTWERLTSLLENQEIIFGGQTNRETLFVAPTLLNNPKLDSPVMTDEIFGPILPIISYRSVSEVSSIILGFEKPLSLYLFSTNSSYINKVLSEFSFGGGCINDTMIHYANSRLPFGGVGHSGIGNYHGKFGFNTFSHQKSVVKKANWLDVPVRYPKYEKKIKWIKKILNWF
jgi:aldehyde dehydrogenase (NAD+)